MRNYNTKSLFLVVGVLIAINGVAVQAQFQTTPSPSPAQGGVPSPENSMGEAPRENSGVSAATGQNTAQNQMMPPYGMQGPFCGPVIPLGNQHGYGGMVVPVMVQRVVPYNPPPVNVMVYQPAQLMVPPVPPMMYGPQAMSQQPMPMMPQQPVPVKMIMPDGSVVSIKHYIPGKFFRNAIRAVTP